MADYYFKMDDMAVGYQGKTLIHDINIGIDKGEIVTLIGPNGSGKSTILKSITKQLKLIGGKVFFDGTSLQEMSYKELFFQYGCCFDRTYQNGAYDLS